MKKLYYISQGESHQEHLQNIKQVCRQFGANLVYVQLRLKDISNKEFLEVAKEALDICNSFNVKLIINDNVFVANEIDCHGIHVGKNDQSPISIRKQFAEHKIIGGTANTLDDCLNLIEQKVDYIGLGPFKHTETKKVLSPVLGVEGCKRILTELKQRNITTPIYVIGGIELTDIDMLLELGFHGVAISSALTKLDSLSNGGATSSQNEDAQNNTKQQRLLNSLTSKILNS